MNGHTYVKLKKKKFDEPNTLQQISCQKLWN
jgi:hypothetical protein